MLHALDLTPSEPGTQLHTIIVPSILPLTVEVELLFWALTEDLELGQETREVKQANMLLSGVRWLSKRLQRRISSDKLLQETPKTH